MRALNLEGGTDAFKREPALLVAHVGILRYCDGMRFRKKPVIIEAEQFLEGQPIPKGVCYGWRCGGGPNDKQPHLHTMHAGQRVNLEFGDWVIPEPDGEHYYPCKPDVFANTYDPILD
jgi:hypothetical protein